MISRVGLLAVAAGATASAMRTVDRTVDRSGFAGPRFMFLPPSRIPRWDDPPHTPAQCQLRTWKRLPEPGGGSRSPKRLSHRPPSRRLRAPVGITKGSTSAMIALPPFRPDCTCTASAARPDEATGGVNEAGRSAANGPPESRTRQAGLTMRLPAPPETKHALPVPGTRRHYPLRCGPTQCPKCGQLRGDEALMARTGSACPSGPYGGSPALTVWETSLPSSSVILRRAA